ncbi:MAG: RraA family protein [Pirellulales bacterium]|nr:RraA family protein [Pirellulales bacterium]
MITRSELEQLQEFDTALLANTIAYIGETPAHKLYLSGDIQSVTPSLGPTVGIAFTCELDSSTPGNTIETDFYWEQMEAMANCHLPVVWIVKTRGSRPEHECVIGDGMAKTLYSVGCRGLVTDGRVRDIAGLLTTPFAAYCRGKIAHHVPLRFLATNRAVEIGGVTIHPGDVIHANSEGIIRIPSGAVTNLPESAVRMRAFEHKAHMMLRRTDLTLVEKQRSLQEFIAEFGFAGCISANAR